MAELRNRPRRILSGRVTSSPSKIMKLVLAACLFTAGAALVQATPADSALVAAMKLPDAANYSWMTTVDDDARSYTIEGQTDRASDYSLVTMPVVATIRRRAGTGSSNSGNVSTVVFRGDEKFVVEVDSTWKTADELASAVKSSPEGAYPGVSA